MATVLTTFTTPNGTIARSEFRSITPKRCKLMTVDLSDELRDEYGLAEGQQLEIAFPFGPRDMRFANQSTIMSQIQRPGKKPLLERQNDPLRNVTFNAVIASTATAAGGRLDIMTGTTPVDDAMQTIERIAQSGATCKFLYGTVALGYFVSITKFDFTVQYRDAEGHPTRVKAEFTLTEKPAFAQELTNLPVIPNEPPPSDPPKPPPPDSSIDWLEALTMYDHEKIDDFVKHKIPEALKESATVDRNVWETIGMKEFFKLPGFPAPSGYSTGSTDSADWSYEPIPDTPN